MPLYTQTNSKIPITLADYPAPFGDALGALYEDSIQSGLSKWFTPQHAGGRVSDSGNLPSGGLRGMSTRSRYRPRTWEIEPDQIVAPEEANRLSAGYDLSKYTRPVSRERLDYDLAMAKTRRERQSIVSRGPNGIGASTAYFAAQFVAQAVQPENIGAAFIPVAGWTARAAGMTEKAFAVALKGSLKNRMAAAIYEGAAGNALIEPAQWAFMSSEHRDYSLSQSFDNVVFGAITGAALRGGIELSMTGARSVSKYMAEQQRAERLKQNVDLRRKELETQPNVYDIVSEIPEAIHKTTLDAQEASLRNGMRPGTASHILNVMPESTKERAAILELERLRDAEVDEAKWTALDDEIQQRKSELDDGQRDDHFAQKAQAGAQRISDEADRPESRLYGSEKDTPEVSSVSDELKTADMDSHEYWNERATANEEILANRLKTLDEAQAETMGLVKTENGYVTPDMRQVEDMAGALTEYRKAHEALLECMAQGGEA